MNFEAKKVALECLKWCGFDGLSTPALLKISESVFLIALYFIFSPLFLVPTLTQRGVLFTTLRVSIQPGLEVGDARNEGDSPGSRLAVYDDFHPVRVILQVTNFQVYQLTYPRAALPQEGNEGSVPGVRCTFDEPLDSFS